MSAMMTNIGKHLASFNVFREPDGLYVTVADARGVADELRGSGAPLHLCAMNALREAMRQMDERAASAMSASGQDPKGLEAKPASATRQGDAPNTPDLNPISGEDE